MHDVSYRVDLSARAQHLAVVTMRVPADVAAGARLVLPTWTPGSYVVRNYVHHVQRIAARAGGAPAPLEQHGTSSWRLPSDVHDDVEVELEVYGNELTVRTNHIDDHHALLIPPATFPYVDGATDRPHRVVIELPEGWQVWGLLPEDDGVFVAADYDHLVDSAFEVGAHSEVAFEVAGVPHRFVWAGHGGRPDLERIAGDAAAIGGAAVELFDGDLPVDAYTFLCTAWDRGGGGLEHRDGSVLMMPAHAFREADGYRRFQALLTHEYLHLWNVKRLTPEALTDVDYELPVHTPSLWVAEGWTAYYDELLLLRAELWDVTRYLDAVAELAERALRRPGRRLQSVRQASHEAWTKFYVSDENSPNVGVSYYEHGALLAWCLDLAIRRDAPGSDGLDDVLRMLWKRFGTSGRGYRETDVQEAASEVAGSDLSWFFQAHVDGHEDPPMEELAGTVGLRLVPKDEDEDDDEPTPDLGVECREDDEGYTFTSVLRGMPAWEAGLTGGDRLLAIDGIRVQRGELPKALRGRSDGETLEFAVFRGPRLVSASVVLGAPRRERTLRAVEDPSDEQRRAFERWAGRPLPTP